MAVHYIIMSSAYTEGVRIALAFPTDTFLDTQEIKKTIDYIYQQCGEDVAISSHLIQTKSLAWESVAEYDPFFEGVVLMNSSAAFCALVNKSRVLSGLDVAKYILSKVHCTHLSLEMLVYLSYADYLCDTSERLFEDLIYAFKCGPVVSSVYSTCSEDGSRHIGSLCESDHNIDATIDEMAISSRILFARNGTKKLTSIDRTIEKYGKCSASELVELTHRDGAPWSYVDSSKKYQRITDDLIAKYHCVECR